MGTVKAKGLHNITTSMLKYGKWGVATKARALHNITITGGNTINSGKQQKSEYFMTSLVQCENTKKKK